MSSSFPLVMIGAVVFLTYTNASMVVAGTTGFLSLTETTYGLALLVVARDLLLGRRLPPRLGLVAIAITVYILSLAVTAFGAHDPMLVMEETLTAAKRAFVAVLLVATINNVTRLRWAFWSLVAGAASLALLTVVQQVLGLQNVDFGGFARVTSAEISNAIDSWRFVGPVDDPNYYAQLLLLGLPAAVLGASALTSPVRRMFLLAVATFITVALALTVSRGAFLALLVVLVFAFWPYRRWRVWVAAFTVIAIGLAVAFAPGPVVDRFVGAYHDLNAVISGDGPISDKAIAGRLAEMQVGLRLFLEHPMLGVGYGNFESLYQDIARQNGLMSRGEDREAHSLYLEILSERGLVGFFVFAGLIGIAIWSAIKSAQVFHANGRQVDAAFARAVTLSIIGYLASSFFLHEAFTTSFWVIIALAFAGPPLRSSSPAKLPAAGVLEDPAEPKPSLTTRIAGFVSGKSELGAKAVTSANQLPPMTNAPPHSPLFAILRRHLAVILGIAFVAAGVGPYVALTNASTYVADGSLLFRFDQEYTPQNIARTGYQGEPIRTTLDRAIQTEMEILGSRSVVEQAIASSNYMPMEDMDRDRFPAFIKALSLRRVEGTQVVRVSFRDPSPEIAKLAIAALFDSYFDNRAKLFGTEPETVLRQEALMARAELTRLRSELDAIVRPAGAEGFEVRDPSTSTGMARNAAWSAQFTDRSIDLSPAVRIADLETEIRLAEERYGTVMDLLTEQELAVRIDRAHGSAIMVLETPGAEPKPTNLPLVAIGVLSGLIAFLMASLAAVWIERLRDARFARIVGATA